LCCDVDWVGVEVVDVYYYVAVYYEWRGGEVEFFVVE